MRTKTEENTQGNEGKQEEQQRLEQKEGDEAFAAGFEKVAGTNDAGDQTTQGEKKDGDQTTSSSSAPEKSDAEKEAEEKARQEAAAKEKAKAEYDALPQVLKDKLAALENLPGQMNTLAGHIGGLKNATTRIEKALTAAKDATTDAGGASPSDAQVKAAMKDPKAWEKLKEDFPDWAGPVEAELTAIREELAKKGGGEKVNVDEIVQKAVTAVRTEIVNDTVEDAHPKWQETVRTKEFAGWLESQPDDVKALSSSSRPKDAIKLLDTYKGHQEEAAKAATRQDTKNRRLENAVNPQGAGGQTESGISDEQAFTRGFKKVAGQRAA